MIKNLSEKPIAELQMEQADQWEKDGLLEKCVSTREGMPSFVFYEGPPTANGRPGIHHVIARTLKDSVCRYKTMQGYAVKRKAGWDTHGLPVEIEVEKQLNMSGKQDIEKYGIKEFNEKCKESVFTYEKDGSQKTFSIDNLPDSSWTFISTETRIKTDAKSLVELSFYSLETGEYMDTLATEGKVMIVSAYDTGMSGKRWAKIEEFMKRSEDAGFITLLLCARKDGIPASLTDHAYISDYKTLISMNRSNGGVTYFHDGTLIRKWARFCAPDSAELKDTFVTDTTEISIDRDSKGSLGFQGFLLYVFAVMLLL